MESELKSFDIMPGPIGFPFIGSAASLTSFPEKTLMQWANDHYGNVFKYKMLGQQCVVLNGYDAVNEGLVMRKSAMSGRVRTSDVFEATRDNRGLFFVDHGNFWKAWRTIAENSLTSVMTDLPKKIEDVANELCSGFLQQAAEEGGPVPLKSAFYRSFGQVIFRATLGKEFSADEQGHLEEFLRRVYAPFSSVHFALLMFSPSLSRFPPFSWYLSTQRTEREKIVAKLIGWIEESVENQDQANVNIVSIYYRGNPKPTLREKESLAILILDLLFAGSATVAQELMWVLLFLMKNQKAMKRMRNELESNTSASALYQSGNGAPYTRAVIQEAMRLRPIAPGSFYHKTTEDTNVDGYIIPKGVAVFPNLWSVHHDSTLWLPDPDAFRPERHLDENQCFVKSKFVIPFSVGERQCAGKRIAEADIFIFLVSIIRKYDIDLSEESKNVDMDGDSVAILQTHDFEVVVKARKKRANTGGTHGHL